MCPSIVCWLHAMLRILNLTKFDVHRAPPVSCYIMFLFLFVQLEAGEGPVCGVPRPFETTDVCADRAQGM